MAEQNTQQVAEDNEPKTFTQEDVNRIVQERIARVKAEVPTDYEELKAKAAKYDEAEEASKSELQKALESAESYKAELEAMKQADAHRKLVAEKAAEYKVDANLLGRMQGDVDENAKYLSETLAAVPKYPSVADGGKPNTEQKPREIPRLI